mgnify:CR=1 FL=1
MNEELLHLRVTEIITETPDARTLVLTPLNVPHVDYRAGQFLTFIFQHGTPHEVRRSYSMSSTPGLDAALRVTVRRVDNGEISRYLVDHLRVGDTLVSLPPAGRFTLDTAPENQRDIVLIGAGSGITPLYALLNQALRNEPLSHIALLYSNASERRIIFRDTLSAIQRANPERFQMVHLLSRPSGDWEGRRGRLNNVLLETLLPDLLRHDRSQALFYVCGPADYMRMVQYTLVFLGIKPEQIRKENFVIGPVIQTPPPGSSQDYRIALTFRGAHYELTVPAYTSILQTALDNGLSLPYSCRGGRCSTCMARRTSGEVQMTINDVLTERDLAEGWVLTCTGYPASEGVRIEV